MILGSVFVRRGFFSCDVSSPASSRTVAMGWDAIPADHEIAGPALIGSPFTTVVVDPAACVRRSADGALLIEP
ncbi:hypothetical protein [Sphingomonas sp.]|uniref:hypothetical protein n=1 Tax=Sphingomonas sp. TaxID=28214 RepID=UPI003AFF8B1E